MLASLSFLLAVLAPGAPASAAQSGGHPGRVVLAAESASTVPSAGTVLVTLEEARAAAGDPNASAVFVASRTAASDAEDRALAEALRGARAIELRGGTWVGWYHAANAGRHEREWTRALRRARAGGTEVRASGGAASFVAQWSPVPRAILDKPAQDPHDTSLDLPVEGLGFFEGPLVGVLTPDAPTADRVVERALAYGYRDVLLLAGGAEFDWDPLTHSARVRIPPAAPGASAGWIAWIDLGAGTCSRGVVRGARATFPRDGDVFSARARALEGAGVSPVAPLGDAALLDDAAVVDDAAVRWLRDELGSARGTAALFQGVSARRDEDTVRSALGGLGGVAIDLVPRTP